MLFVKQICVFFKQFNKQIAFSRKKNQKPCVGARISFVLSYNNNILHIIIINVYFTILCLLYKKKKLRTGHKSHKI